MQNSLEQLSDELKLKIASYLPANDQAKLAQTNQDFNRVMHDSTVHLSQQKTTKWQQAVATQNADKIKEILLTGYLPADLITPITVNTFMGAQAKSLVEIVLTGNALGQDKLSFNIADRLLAAGAPAPSAPDKSAYENTADYLKSLAGNDIALYLALRFDPSVITMQDESGMTVLHYAAKIGFTMGSSSASLILHLLFTSPLVDFSIQDNQGNTPLHVAALCCEDRVTYQYVFPHFVKEAAKSGFNFSTLNNHGQAILHIAARTTYTDRRFGLRNNNIANVLKNAPDIDLNVLSSSGSTAFFYAVNFVHLNEANTLLEAGANPNLSGAPDRDPVAQIGELIDAYQTELANNNHSPAKNALIIEYIEAVTALKKSMLTSTFANKQQEGEKFPFWGKTTETKQWSEVKCDAAENPEFKPSGPGYGF